MCMDRVVIGRDVTDVALIGDDETYTKPVHIQGGETVYVTEPSTVIDCRGCSTGFAFQNVSRLTLKRILIRNCGAYFRELLLNTQFISSLTLTSIYTLTLDTVSFHSKGRNFNLVAINVLGPSTINTVSVIQKVYPTTSYTLQEGSILISFTDDLPVQCNKDSVNSSIPEYLSIDNLVMLYTEDADLGSDRFLILNLLSCALDSINILVQNVRVHIFLNTKIVPHTEEVVIVEVTECVNNYQLYIKDVNFTASISHSHLTYRPVYMIHAFVVHFSGKNSQSQSFARKMEFSKLLLSDEYQLLIYSSAYHSCIDKYHHQLVFDDCRFPHFTIIIDSPECTNITISDTSFEYRAYSENLFDYADALFEATHAKKIKISDCTFAHNSLGPGIHLIQSQITFSGNCVIHNNTADYGGGILLDGKSLIYLSPDTTLNFTGNTAKVTGGAIHITGSYIDGIAEYCTFQINMIGFSSLKNDIKLIAEKQDIKIVFDSNTARIAGTTIWGGSLDSCIMNTGNRFRTRNILPLLGLNNTATNPSVIASAPLHMCYCYSNQTLACTPNRKWHYTQIPSFSIYPGQSLELDIAMAGQLNGLVPGLVEASIDLLGKDINVRIDDVQRTQRIDRAECTKFIYTFYTTTGTVENIRIQLVLQIAEHATIHLDYVETADVTDTSLTDVIASLNYLHINVKLKNCPLGFHHDPVISSCVCHKAILKYISSPCDINTQTVKRTPTLWMNVSYTGDNTQILAVHQHCPFDYCNHNKLRVNFSAPDQQCAHNRAGDLCGGCKTGLSLTLGSPKCKRCSNSFISLLVVFIAAGLALVTFLTILNLTVSTGTINALILYANIIRALNPIFFPTTTFLSVFVAWLNLDIGIDTCFYDGLDFYSLTWLQFVFPVYIWLLVSVIIITSHYSTTMAKLISRDAVKVLATLFLLSYAKLLRTILTVFSFTYISYEDTNGTTHQTAVWLYDGNVEFARGKHIPLLLTALSFTLVYIIPFTALLLFAPFLQTRSHRYTFLKWVNKLMPFLDAYQGPYNDKFRFWPGLTLLFRLVLFISFALNSLGDPDIDLMLTTTLVFVLLSFEHILGMGFKSDIPYKNTYLNYLETFYLLNLGVVCTWSVLQPDRITSSETRQPSVTSSVLVGLAFIVFIGILGYHVYLRIQSYSVLVNLFKRSRKQREEVPTTVTRDEQTMHSRAEEFDVQSRESPLENSDIN